MDDLAINGGKPVSKTKILMAKPIFSKKTISDIEEVVSSGNIRQGPKTLEFENEFRKKVGAEHAYAANSGTAALHIAFMSILEKGDEVLVPAFTFIATASTIALSGGRPVFVEIDEETFMIDTEDTKEGITSKTKAIAPVHLFGNAADMKALGEIAEDHDLLLVNDAAQAHGTEINGKDIGSFNDLNCYSFYPTKTMTTGEGGMVTTNNQRFLETGKLIRSHGEASRYNHTVLGLNYRMTEIAAVIGLEQLEHLDDFLVKRRKNAAVLTEGLKTIDGLRPQRVREGINHSYSYYSIVMDPYAFSCDRDEFVQALEFENIECSVHYPIPLNEQQIFKRLYGEKKCPVSEDISQTIFSVPVHPSLSEKDLASIIAALEKVSSYYLKQ